MQATEEKQKTQQTIEDDFHRIASGTISVVTSVERLLYAILEEQRKTTLLVRKFIEYQQLEPQDKKKKRR